MHKNVPSWTNVLSIDGKVRMERGVSNLPIWHHVDKCHVLAFIFINLFITNEIGMRFGTIGECQGRGLIALWFEEWRQQVLPFTDLIQLFCRFKYVIHNPVKYDRNLIVPLCWGQTCWQRANNSLFFFSIFSLFVHMSDIKRHKQFERMKKKHHNKERCAIVSLSDLWPSISHPDRYILSLNWTLKACRTLSFLHLNQYP